MSFRTWWLENKLHGFDQKLKRLRFAQKRIREKEAVLQAAKRARLSAAELEARESKLQADRDDLTRAIGEILLHQQRLKRELENTKAAALTR